MLFPEDIEFVNEAEKENFMSTYNQTIECIQRFLPHAEYELDDNLGVHVWIPFVDVDGLDRGLDIGTVYILEKNSAGEYQYKSHEQICEGVKELRDDFIDEYAQICEVIKEFERAKE